MAKKSYRWSTFPMTKVAISVEGQTEDEFCKNILCPYFQSKNIILIPIIVTTKRKKCGTKHKGGCVNLDRVKSEIENYYLILTM